MISTTHTVIQDGIYHSEWHYHLPVTLRYKMISTTHTVIQRWYLSLSVTLPSTSHTEIQDDIYHSHCDTRWYLSLSVTLPSTSHTEIQDDIYCSHCDTTWYLPLAVWYNMISTTHIAIQDNIYHSHCDTRWYLPLTLWYKMVSTTCIVIHDIYHSQRHYDLVLTGWHSWRRYAVTGTVAWHFHEAAEQTHCPGVPSQQPPGSYPPCRGPVLAMSAPSSEPSRSAALTPARKCHDWRLIHNTFKMLQLATHSQHLQNAAIGEPFTTPSKCYDWWLAHTFKMLQLVIRSQHLQNAMICNSFTKASKCSCLQLIHNTFKMLWLEIHSQHRWNAKISCQHAPSSSPDMQCAHPQNFPDL